MKPFIKINQVRDAFQFTDTVKISDTDIAKAITKAHKHIIENLKPDTDTEHPDTLLISAEVILSGAYVLRGLAWTYSDAQRHAGFDKIGRQSVIRFREYHEASDMAEAKAEYMLEPYIK